MTDLWDLKDILNSRQNRSERLVNENALTREHRLSFVDEFVLDKPFHVTL